MSMTDLELVESISSTHKIPFTFLAGVYFLVDNSEVVYVGSSISSTYARVGQHMVDKDFDSAYCLPIYEGVEKIREVEASFIYFFRPKYNGPKPHLPKSLSYNEVRDILAKYGICLSTPKIIDGARHTLTCDFEYKRSKNGKGKFVFYGCFSHYSQKLVAEI